MKKVLLVSLFLFSTVKAVEHERVTIGDINDVEEVVKYFAPLVYLSRGEKWFPSSVDWYLKRVALKDANLNVIKAMGQVTPQDLANNPDKGNVLDPNGDHVTYVGQDLEHGQVVAPMYLNYKVIDDSTANLQSIFFYPFNGATPFPSCFKWPLYDVFGISMGNHEADVEHSDIFIKINEDDEASIEKMFFARHDHDGNFLMPKDIDFEDSHPIVYSAKYGHASYGEAPFCLNRYLDTVESGGARWEGWKHHEILDRDDPSDQHKWIPYKGHLGVYNKENAKSAGTKPAPQGLEERNWFAKIGHY